MEQKEQEKKRSAEYSRTYRAANKKKIAENHRKYNEANKEKIAEYHRKYHEANKKKIAEKRREYCEANKAKIAEYHRKYHEANKKEIAEKKREYNADPANKAKLARRQRERLRTDTAYAIKRNLSRRLNKIMKGVGGVKPATTMKIVGCTRDELLVHLASKFKPGMTMENQGSYWHVDHIMPCAAFDHHIPAQVRTCWHYTNLQPLEAKENQSKGCKITVPQMSLPLNAVKNDDLKPTDKFSFNSVENDDLKPTDKF